jgi:uncharacterized protein YjiS (DUF1127 family)
MMGSFAASAQRFRHRPGLSRDSLGASARSILAMVQLWRARARVRRELAARSERELQDMGTCWSSIANEIGKPFWLP